MDINKSVYGKTICNLRKELTMSRPPNLTESPELVQLRQQARQTEIKERQDLLKEFLAQVKKMIGDQAELHLPKDLEEEKRSTITQPQVFISYAWEAAGTLKLTHLQTLLTLLGDDLRATGLITWFDKQRMTGDLEKQMREGIKDSQYVLMIGTNRYAERTKPDSDTNVRKELDFTMQESKKSSDFLLPLMLEGDYETTFPKCDLYLMSEFDIRQCEQEIKGNAVILTNQNTAYFIINDKIIMDDLKPQIVQAINRQKIPPCSSIKPKKYTLREKKKEKIINESVSKGGHTPFHNISKHLIRDCRSWYSLEQGAWKSSEDYIDYIKGLTQCEPLGILPCLLGLNRSERSLIQYRRACLQEYKEKQRALMNELQLLPKRTHTPDVKINPTPNPSRPSIQLTPVLEIPFDVLEYDKKADKIGTGSYGEVFRGWWQGKPVAIKELTGNVTAIAEKDLYREAGIMAYVAKESKEPCPVVRLFGLAVSKPNYALVMEYLPHGTLFDLLQTQGEQGEAKLPWDLRYQLALDIADGVALVHRQKILHRDLRSPNILLTIADGHLRGKLSDFGLSTVKSSVRATSTTRKTDSVARRAWIAPELHKRGGQSSMASDMYSYGMVLWELLKVPYTVPFANAEGDESLISKWIVDDGETETIPGECPLKLGELIKQCWSLNPEDRPTIESMQQELKALVATHPLSEETQAIIRKLMESQQSHEAKWSTGWQEKRRQQMELKTCQLLQLVAEGEQDKAEALIREDKNLLLHAGKVKDLSDREFKHITAFQYALWAMDWHMWTMIQNYLPLESQTDQLRELETKSTEYGTHFRINVYRDAIDAYMSKFSDWDWGARGINWRVAIGGLQRQFPAHVVNEYCREDRAFEPCPSEWESKLPRTRKAMVDDRTKPDDLVEGSWFISPSSEDGLGRSYAFVRYQGMCPAALRELCSRLWDLKLLGFVCADSNALLSLWEKRTDQLEKLKSQLLSTPGQTQISQGISQTLMPPPKPKVGATSKPPSATGSILSMIANSFVP
jgi:serine/threonine protein kinase